MLTGREIELIEFIRDSKDCTMGIESQILVYMLRRFKEGPDEPNCARAQLDGVDARHLDVFRLDLVEVHRLDIREDDGKWHVYSDNKSFSQVYNSVRAAIDAYAASVGEKK